MRAAAVAALVAGLLAPAAAPAQTDPLTFTDIDLPEATKLQPYDDGGDPPSDVFITVTGGVPPYSFRRIGGALPDGMTLESSGRISGTPTRCQTAVFRVQVTDSFEGFINGTFVLDVEGNGNLVVPASVDGAVEAGGETELQLDLTNTGCEDVIFHLESEDVGFFPPAAAAGAETSGLQGLMEIGGPVPRTLGTRDTPRRPTSEGWAVEDGLLVDGSGNVAGTGSPEVRTGLQLHQQGEIRILYVNETLTTGEIERFESLGFLVTESMVPQALGLATLRAFDVLYLTGASDVAFPSRDAIRQYVWEGGGLILEQVQISGEVSMLPPGFRLDALAPAPAGDNDTIAFTLEGSLDPLTAPLFESDLPSSFDTTRIETSEARWTWLAGQDDIRGAGGDLLLGTLARARLGGGHIIYLTGNLGTSLAPGASAGSDDFVFNLILEAASGSPRASCPWLRPGKAVSDERPEAANTGRVQSLDLTGETVTLTLEIDASGLEVGSHVCDVSLITDQPDGLERTFLVTLTVDPPVLPTITHGSFTDAEPGVPYADALEVAGGTPPYSFQQVGGTLPAGLTFASATGVVGGTPTEAGLFEPVFEVTDSLAASSQRTVALRSGFHVVTEALPDAIIGQVYSEGIFVSGGVPPYTFRLEDAVDFTLPVDDPNTPAADACVTTDLGGGRTSTDCVLGTGFYNLTFDAVDGFATPPSRDAEVTPGGLTVVEADYLALGSVTVTSNTPLATYTLEGETDAGRVLRLGAGAAVEFTGLPPGDYTATFDPAFGFATPPPATGTLTEGGSLTLNGDFELLPGVLVVRTNLIEATYTLTGDTVDGPVTVAGGGIETVFIGQPEGTYTVTFDDVAGFTTPSPVSGTLTPTAPLELAADYVAATALVRAALDGRVQTLVDASPPAAFEEGFDTGTLRVVTDAGGATFRLRGHGAPGEMALIEPGGGIGNAAAYAGAMLNIGNPLLQDGQSVPVTVIVEDSDSPPNRIRRTYAVNVFDLPSIDSVVPNSSAQGLVFDLEVFGFGLRTSATLTLSDDIDIGALEPGPGVGALSSVIAEARVAGDAVISTRDLIYTDPTLSMTALGSAVRFSGALRVFNDMNGIDLDASGRVDGFDLARVARAFGLSSGDPGFDAVADLTRDGAIDGDDVGALALVFGRLALSYDEATLPPVPGTVGQAYEHEIGFQGGNGTLGARLIDGRLPDGVNIVLLIGSDPPRDSVLRLEGVPAEAGSFELTVQTLDGVFAVATRTVTLVIDAP